MHCLYCDRPLALLKRLTGDGEFCSKEHRKIYQREHSQLALARLLEGQSKSGAGRPVRAPAAVPAPEIKNEIPARPENQPGNAGFIADPLASRAASQAIRPGSSPRFELGSPVWSGADAQVERSQPGPKTATFLANDPPQPRAAQGPAKREEKYSFEPPRGSLRLEESSTGAALAGAAHPTGGGFLFHSFEASNASAALSRSAQPRFAAAPGPLPGPAGAAWSAANPAMRPAEFVAGAPLGGKEPAAAIRRSAMAPQWKPLEPAMPEQEPGKITLLPSAFLERPVRPASQERPSDTVDPRIQPLAFPLYPPRMGCLEERLHRTDRIGFSPP